MSDFFEGQAVTVKYSGRHGVVVSVSAASVVVQIGDRVMYLKHQDVRPQ